jgi:hypothetical protein
VRLRYSSAAAPSISIVCTPSSHSTRNMTTYAFSAGDDTSGTGPASCSGHSTTHGRPDGGLRDSLSHRIGNTAGRHASGSERVLLARADRADVHVRHTRTHQERRSSGIGAQDKALGLASLRVGVAALT